MVVEQKKVPVLAIIWHRLGIHVVLQCFKWNTVLASGSMWVLIGPKGLIIPPYKALYAREG